MRERGTYNTSISLPSLCNSNISAWYLQAHTSLLFLFHLSVILIFLYDTSKHIQHLELQRDAWKRNISDVCAWKYHTEILELQRDTWKRNRSVVCAWKYHTEILELQRDGREIEVMYHIHHFYFSSTHLSVILIFLYDTSKHIQHFYFSSISL
jgi:hypothetical protein